VRAEEVVLPRVEEPPRPLVDLMLELPRCPPGVTGEDADRWREVGGSGEVDGRPGAQARADRTGQRDHHLGGHRPTREDDAWRGGLADQERGEVTERTGERAVQHDPQRAVVVVVDEQHHRPAEGAVGEHRRGDEQLPGPARHRRQRPAA